MSLKISPITMAIIFSLSIVSSNLSVAQNMGEVSDTNNNLVGISTAQENKDLSDNLDAVTINDPVATYNGIPISKADFLDFIESLSGVRTTLFASEDILKSFLQSYIITDLQARIIIDSGFADSKEAKEILRIIDDILLAKMLENTDQSSRALIEDEFLKKDQLTNRMMISDEAIGLVAKLMSHPAPVDYILEHEEMRKEVADEYQKNWMLAEIARSLGFDKKTEFLNKKKYEIGQYYSMNYIQKLIDEAAPSKEELDAFYFDWKSRQELKFYKASQIYIEDPEIAQKVLELLRSGAITFIEAVDKYSTHQLSKEYSGKLGRGDWFSFMGENNLSVAIENLEIGEYSDVIRGPAGAYHILLLEDSKVDNSELDLLDANEKIKREIWNKELIDKFYNRLFDKVTIVINK